MNHEQFVKIQYRIGELMGWPLKRSGFTTYWRSRLMADLNTLHPNIVTSRAQLDDILRTAADPKRHRVPAYWDKVMLELLERAVSGKTHPPLPGPLFNTILQSRSDSDTKQTSGTSPSGRTNHTSSPSETS